MKKMDRVRDTLITYEEWKRKHGESLEILPREDLAEVELRRPDRPPKAHAELADKFLEVRKAIDELQHQTAAVNAVIREKEQISAEMAKQLVSYAQEYKDRMIRTKRILLQLEDIPPHKAQTPQWKQAIEFLLKKLENISVDMRKEAEKFVEGTKREIPGTTELRYKELEGITSSVAESWIEWRTLWEKITGMAASVRDQIRDAEKNLWELLSSLEA